MLKLDTSWDLAFYKRQIERLRKGDKVGRIEGGAMVDETAATIVQLGELAKDTAARQVGD